jgi:hypothetical protein
MIMSMWAVSSAQVCPQEFTGAGKYITGKGRLTCKEETGAVAWTIYRPEVRRRSACRAPRRLHDRGARRILK